MPETKPPLQFIILGSSAGGGFPQWNCKCANCQLAWAQDSRVLRRTQASLAVSADGQRWVVLSASPDLRQQILDTPKLHPKHGLRHTPISGVFVPSGDIDHLAGLLVMRESQPFTLWGTAATLAEIEGSVFDVLNPAYVKREAVELERPIETGLGFTLTPFAAPGKLPLYREPSDIATLDLEAEGEHVVGVEISDGMNRHYYLPSCARVTAKLHQRLQGAKTVFFDGTTYENDEMITQGLSQKTAARMGHMAMNGAGGSLATLRDIAIERRIFIHINNSNPVLRHDSAERAAVEAAGWEIGYDGMEIQS